MATRRGAGPDAAAYHRDVRRGTTITLAILLLLILGAAAVQFALIAR